MTRVASRKIVDLAAASLRRQGVLSDEEVRVRTFAASKPFTIARDPRRATTPTGAIVADEPSPEEVRDRITQLARHVATQLRAGELPRVDLPHLHRTNAIYDERGNVFIGRYTRPLALDRHGGQSFVRLLLALATASDNLRDGTCTTKRGLFYQHRAAIPDACQTDTDRAIVALANVLRVRRKSLGFVEVRRGSVYGRLVLREGSQAVDLAQVGAAGRTIPRFTDDVEIVSSDATRVIVIEKDAVAFKLARDRIWETARCVMVCSSGFPSMSTREFVRKLGETLRVPVVVFADGDPAGIRVALTFAHGSISTALETPWLATNDVQWGGFCPSDFARHGQKRDEIQLSARDQESARELLESASTAHVNDRVRKELSVLLASGFKAELDSLLHDSRLNDYVHHKLESGDLVKL